jgi:hypothetical protein
VSGIARTEGAFGRIAPGWILAQFVGLVGEDFRNIAQVPSHSEDATVISTGPRARQAHTSKKPLALVAWLPLQLASVVQKAGWSLSVDRSLLFDSPRGIRQVYVPSFRVLPIFRSDGDSF